MCMLAKPAAADEPGSRLIARHSGYGLRGVDQKLETWFPPDHCIANLITTIRYADDGWLRAVV